MKKHYETHVEDTDKLISVAGPVLDYKSWYEQYRKLMEEQAQRKYGLYTPQEVDVLVEQIPEYEGYLVTDGVDDKVQSSSYTMNEDWTIVGDWELLSIWKRGRNQ